MTSGRARQDAAGVVALATLHPADKNARQHPDRELDLIVDSLRSVGTGRSIVVDEDGQILAGNATVQAAQKAGHEKVQIVESDGSTLIAVRRRGLTDAQKHALAIFDNRTAELARWDADVLRELVGGDMDLTPFWSEDELKNLLMTPKVQAGLTDPEVVPALRGTAIQPGDLFELGPHRLLCGDSTAAPQVERVMGGARARLFATDPPYLVAYDGKNHPSRGAFDNPKRNKDWAADYKDGRGRDLYEGFVAVARSAALDVRAAWYCWHASRRQALLEEVWNAHEVVVHQQIIWAKTRPTLTFSIYLWAHEPCLFGWVKGHKPFVRRGFPDGHPSTVWQIPSSEVDSKDHPTSKPTRCFTLPMDVHTVAGEICFEPFCGSGSQIIAAQMLDRRCFAIEIEPQFVQVTLDRWEAFTGQKAVKVGEAARPAGSKRAKGARS